MQLLLIQFKLYHVFIVFSEIHLVLFFVEFLFFMASYFFEFVPQDLLLICELCLVCSFLRHFLLDELIIEVLKTGFNFLHPSLL